MTAEIQDRSTGQWRPYPQFDDGIGNIRIDGQSYSHDAGAAAYQQTAATVTEAPGAPPGSGPAPPLSPSDPNFDPNVNNPTTWDPGADHPNETYPGWHWDPGMFRYVQGDAPAAGGGDTTGGGDTGAPPAAPPAAPSHPQVEPGPGGLDPWGGMFTPTGDAATDPGDMPLYDAPEWTAPTWTQPEAFVAPKGSDIYDDPGYQFRADQGQQRLEASAASKGLLRSGGTLKDILGYGQSLASQEYGDVYNRRAGEYSQKYNAAMDTFRNNYGASRDEYDRLAAAKAAEYAPLASAWEAKRTDRQNAYDRQWKAYLQSWDEFNADRNFKLRALGG